MTAIGGGPTNALHNAIHALGRVETLGHLEHHTSPYLLHCSMLLDGFYLFEGLGINRGRLTKGKLKYAKAGLRPKPLELAVTA